MHFAQVVAALALVLGVGAMLAWWLHASTWLQAGTGRVPIQFNTALGLALMGAALIALLRRHRLSALLLPLPVLALALPGLYQELSGVDVGIDQLLFDHPFSAEGVPPGRMAPNTAFALTVASLTVWLLVLRWGRSNGRLAASVGGALMLILALVVFAGYAFDVPLARAWGERTPMALQTAVGLTLLAIAFIAHGWSAWNALAWPSRALTFACGLLAVVLSLTGWMAMDKAMSESLNRTVESEADELAAAMESRARRILTSVPALARRLGALDAVPDAADFLREAGLHAEVFDATPIIGWNAPDGTVLRLTSRELDPEQYAHVVGSSVMLDAPRRAAFSAAIEERRPVLSARTRLASTGASSLLLFAPVVHADRVVGVVGGALDLDRLFSDLRLLADSGLSIAVMDGDDLLWEMGAEQPVAVGASRRREVELAGRRLSLLVTPQAPLMRAVRGNLPEIVLMVGLIAAALLTLALTLAGLARQRMRQAEDSRRELEQAEHRAGRVLDGMTDGFLALDRDWRYVRVNRRAQAMLRKDDEDLLGRRVWEVFPELIDTETQHHFERAMREGAPFEYEMYYEPHRLWFEVRGFPSEEGLAVYFRDITQRRLESMALKRREEQLREAQTLAAVGSWEYEVARSELSVSANFLVLHGLGDEPFEGDWAGFLQGLPADLAEAMVEAQRCAMSGERAHVRYLLEVGGERREFEVVALADLDAEGKPRVVSATCQDVTERQKARRVLEASEARHRGIVEAALDAIVTIDVTGRITEFNPAAEVTFGHAREAVLGRDMADIIIPPALRTAHRQGMASHLADGRTRILGRRLQMHALHADGGEFPVELAISRLGYDDPPSFTGFVRDISDRLQAERELRRQAQIIDQIHDAVAEVDMDGIVRTWNKGSERMLGYSAEEMIGTSIERIYPPEFLERRHALVIEPLLVSGEHHLELEQVRKNGTRVWVSLSLSLLRDEHGVPVGSLGYSVDITRRRLAEEELRLQQRAIESSANGIILVDAADPQHPILFVNPAFERITGYAAEEVVGRNCRFLQREDRDQAGLAALRAAIRDGDECRVLLRNYRRDGSLFWNELHVAPVHDEHGAITHFVGVQNDVSERRQQELLLEHRAIHDQLTGLPNRPRMLALLGEALAAAHASSSCLRVVLVNLDRLHQVNDALGYAVGDQVLLEAAQRLLRVAGRCGAELGRIGGDEFLLVGPPRSQGELDEGLAERAIGELSRPYEVYGQRVFLTASAGVSHFPEASDDPVTLVAYADIAVNRAKQAGRNQAVEFNRDMAAALADRVAVGAALRVALSGDELELHLQPLVDARDGSMRAAEALMRWTSAELGPVSPARFVPVAEDSGLIVVLGDWALRNALEHAAGWKAPRRGETLPISVNVSAVQFQRPEFLNEVEDALVDSGLSPASLKLEITESVVMEDAEQAISLLKQLRVLGVRVSLDDFGTGHSSLGYLRHLPIDEIKIDRMFVKDVVHDRYAATLCRTIITMSRELGMAVVAEGVETEAQARFLAGAGCQLLQGYLFSRPLPATELAQLLEAGVRWNLDGTRRNGKG